MATPGLLLLVIAPSLAAAGDIWHFSLAYGPALPPDQRPPFSRDATYDPSQLKYQIPAIVGSYVAIVLVLGFCLITFGRRRRREAQDGVSPFSQEMVKPHKPYEITPTSPQGSVQALWGKWGARHGSTKSRTSNKSPIIGEAVSFDPHVIQHDKVARQDEMEKIYAQIMAQDTKAPRSVISLNGSEAYTSDGGYASSSKAHGRNTSTGTRASSQRQGSQRYSDAPVFMPSHPQRSAAYPQAMSAAPSYQANDSSASMNSNPALAGYYPSAELMSSPPPIPPPSARPLDPSSPRQLPPPYSHIRQISGTSVKSKRSARGSIRGLQISSPIPIPDQTHEPQPQPPVSPRTPRWYKDPGRPPTPPTASLRRSADRRSTRRSVDGRSAGFRDSMDRPSTPFEDDSDLEIEKMTSPGIPRGRSERRIPDFESSDDEIIETDSEDDTHITESIAHGYNGITSPLPPPSAAPQRQVGRTPPPPSLTLSGPGPAPYREQGLTVVHNTLPGTMSRTTTPGTMSRTNTPGALSFRSQNKTPAGSSSNTLPFRAFHPPPQSPTSGVAGMTMSPGPIKTTFLSPRRDLPGGMHAIGPHGIVPNTAALLSAGLATPYSPYMPFSPMTPVTPHLINRRERRQMEKEKGRQAATEDDIVKDEKDLWGDGY